MTKLYAALALALIGLMVGVMAVFAVMGRGDDQFADCRSSQISGGVATIGGSFELINQHGQTVTDTDVIDRPALIYFGYSYCPDVCPLDNARNVDAVDVLADRGIDVVPVFISIDPARDTPQELSDYAAAMHPKMIALTGTPAQVDAVSKAYKTFYRKSSDDPQDYLMDHSTFTYLVSPEHGFLEFFRRDISAETLADRTICFLNAS